MMPFVYLILVLQFRNLNTTTLSYAYSINNNLFDWETQTFNCYNSVTYSQIITFGGAFVNPPKIIVTPEFYDSNNAFPCEFTFNIYGITTTQFSASIYCQTSQRTWRFRFRWIALDDQRVEAFYILQNFTGLSSWTSTIPHQNPNAIQGYITAFSLGYKGYIDYILAITSLNTSHLTVSFTSSNKNILSIGFQVVLGTAEAFTQSTPIITNSITPTSYYSSETITFSGNYKLLMLPLQKASIPISNQIRVQIVETDTATTKQYILRTNIDSLADSITHSRIWMNGVNSKVLVPLLLSKMRVTRIFDMTCYSKPFFQIKFTELNLTLSSNFNNNYLISNTTQNLNILVSYQCPVSLKISGFFLKCMSCTQNKTIINQLCYKNINKIIDVKIQNIVKNLFQIIFILKLIQTCSSEAMATLYDTEPNIF